MGRCSQSRLQVGPADGPDPGEHPPPRPSRAQQHAPPAATRAGSATRSGTRWCTRPSTPGTRPRATCATVPAWRRSTRGEPRWPVTISVIVAIVLQRLLPDQLALRPLPVMPAARPGGRRAGRPGHRQPGADRAAGRLRPLGQHRADPPDHRGQRGLGGPAHPGDPARAARTPAPRDRCWPPGAAIWATNVIAFALWYWEFDRGGPVHRAHGTFQYLDFLFPQMTIEHLTAARLGAAVRGLPVPVVHQRHRVQPDRCDAAGPLGQADHAGPVGGVARRWARW